MKRFGNEKKDNVWKHLGLCGFYNDDSWTSSKKLLSASFPKKLAK